MATGCRRQLGSRASSSLSLSCEVLEGCNFVLVRTTKCFWRGSNRFTLRLFCIKYAIVPIWVRRIQINPPSNNKYLLIRRHEESEENPRKRDKKEEEENRLSQDGMTRSLELRGWIVIQKSRRLLIRLPPLSWFSASNFFRTKSVDSRCGLRPRRPARLARRMNYGYELLAQATYSGQWHDSLFQVFRIGVFWDFLIMVIRIAIFESITNLYLFCCVIRFRWHLLGLHAITHTISNLLGIWYPGYSSSMPLLGLSVPCPVIP
jgi:hypothetical protein